MPRKFNRGSAALKSERFSVVRDPLFGIKYGYSEQDHVEVAREIFFSSVACSNLEIHYGMSEPRDMLDAVNAECLADDIERSGLERPVCTYIRHNTYRDRFSCDAETEPDANKLYSLVKLRASGFKFGMRHLKILIESISNQL